MRPFSRRVSFPSKSNAISQALAKQERAGGRLFDLTISNPTKAFDDYPHLAISRALGEVTNFSYEPDASGMFVAREAIVRYYRTRNIPITAERILVTASTSEAYTYIFKLLCDPGDQILSPLPSYPLFEYLAGLSSIEMVPYRLRYDGAWHIDFEHLRKQFSPRARGIVVVNPNNPTGHYLSEPELARLLEFAQEFELPIISDEVFMDYSIGASPDIVRSLLINRSGLSFSMNGLSKTAGMPQMKLAWIALGGDEAHFASARERLELIADTYLSVSTPVQKALPELFRIGDGIQTDIRERTAANLLTLDRYIDKAAAGRLHFEGGWSAIVRLPRTCTEEQWVIRLIEECGVVAQPGYYFDMESEAHIVLSLLSRPEEFRCGMDEIVRLAATRC